MADDDEDDRVVFSEALREVVPHLTCTYAEDGIQLLDLLDEVIVMPRIIFLDVNMPKLGGLNCLKILKQDKRLKDVQIVIYSTTSNDKEIKAFELNGAQFLKKPDSYDELKRILKGVLR